MIDEDIFDKISLVTIEEGKSLISIYLAKNVDSLRINHSLSLFIDSVLHLEGCTCTQPAVCNCDIYTVHVLCSFTSAGTVPQISRVETVRQRKEEAELAQTD